MSKETEKEPVKKKPSQKKKQTKEKEPVCSFCGCTADPENDVLLIKGTDNVYICSDCIEQCALLIEEEQGANQEKETFSRKDITPSKIKAYLDEYIIGQDYAKETLSTAVYNHYKMIEYNELPEKKQKVELQKSNIILMGPTGCGKTYMLKTLAKYLDVPLAITDANSLTQAGYVGDDVEQAIVNLLQACDYDLEKAQKGIVFFDEIDKIGRKGDNPSITRDVSGEGVQQAILKMTEGAIINVPPNGGRKHPMQECIKVDTTNILFIIGGAFEGMDKIIEKRINTGTAGIGFGSALKDEKEFNEIINKVTVEDFVKFGIIPELIGRFPVIATLNELDNEALVSILTKPKNATAKQFQELFSMDDIKLSFEDDALNEIANLARTRKTGARALRGIIEEILHPYMFSFPDDKTIKEVIITKDTVLKKADPIIKRRKKAAS